MKVDRNKLPKIMASGPPELVDKKTKDWRKGHWKSEQARLRQPPRFRIRVDVMNDLDHDMMKKNYPRLMFDHSNNQMFENATSYLVSGIKAELSKFLVSDFVCMCTDDIVKVYPELG